MSSRIPLLFIVSLGALLFAGNAQSKELWGMTTAWQFLTVLRTPTRAKAKIAVQSSEAKPHDQAAGPALMEICLSETFSGSIDGKSTVRA